MKTALTIAGSDPSGGAGIQADLKTFKHFNIHGLSAITAIAVQNSKGVTDIVGLQPDVLERQIETLFSDFRIDAVKTGMLHSKENISSVESALKRHRVVNYVLDPILISTSGFHLLESDAVSILKERLFPLATLITPNLKEAEILSGQKIRNKMELQAAAEKLSSLGPKGVLIKGFKDQNRVIDLLYMGKVASSFESEWIPDKIIHGAGCILSAAITASIASGKGVPDAVKTARSFVLERIKTSARPGKGSGFYYLT